MTRREKLLDVIQRMNAKALYTLYDESFRTLDVVGDGPGLCDLCPYHETGSCSLPFDEDCPTNAYEAWINTEASEYAS